MVRNIIRLLVVAAAVLIVGGATVARAVESVYQYTLTVSAGSEVSDGKIGVGKSTTITATLKDKSGAEVAADVGSWTMSLTGKGSLGSATPASGNKSASAQYTASNTVGDKGTVTASAKKGGTAVSGTLELTAASIAKAPAVTSEPGFLLEEEVVAPTGGVLNSISAIFAATGIWPWIIILAGLIFLLILLAGRKKEKKAPR